MFEAERLRRLPYVATPAPTESFASWLTRTAAMLDIGIGQLAEVLRLPKRRARGVLQVRCFGRSLDPTALASVTRISGLSAREVLSLQVTSVAGSCVSSADLDPMIDRAAHRWGWQYGSRWCPRCLAASDGRWPLEWKLSYFTTCPEHSLILGDGCPRCGQNPRDDGRNGPPVLSRLRRQGAEECWAPMRRGPCRCQLSQAGVVRAPAALLRSQELLSSACATGTLTMAGAPTPVGLAFQRLYALAAAVRFAADPALLPPSAPRQLAEALARDTLAPEAGGMRAYYTARPRDCATSAAVLLVLAPAVLAASSAGFDEALEPLATAAAARRRRIGRDPLQGLPLPPEMKRRMRPPMPHARLARHLPGRHEGAMTRAGTVPEVLPYRLYVPDLCDQLQNTFEWTGRRFCALAIARARGSPSWPEAGEFTGTGRDLALMLSSTIPKRIPDAVAFWLAIDRATLVLQREGVDYPLRRRQMHGLLTVPVEWVQETIPPKALWTPERAHHAATFIWTEWAGGDYRSSPAMSAPRWAASLDSRREGWRCWSQWAPAALRETLLERALQIVSAQE